MLERIVERSVAWAIAHAKLVIALSLALTVAAAFYAAHTLKMDSNTANMISPSLPWKQEMGRIDAAFPQDSGLLVVMIEVFALDHVWPAGSANHDPPRLGH